jgi:hypothetical protein
MANTRNSEANSKDNTNTDYNNADDSTLAIMSEMIAAMQSLVDAISEAVEAVEAVEEVESDGEFFEIEAPMPRHRRRFSRKEMREAKRGYRQRR